ncbi:MAG: hypothetical protein IT307_13320, partial [Chloroflexi bacterium]|nr:hypothetical protein [Chloroflexota bacterium]
MRGPIRRHGRLAALGIFSILILALVVAPSRAEEDQRYFPASGFRIDDDQFWDFFSAHGAARAFGLPISRTFVLQGNPTQIFEHHVLQIIEGNVVNVALLDNGWMPFPQIAYAAIPGYDPSVTASAPLPGAEAYVDLMYAYLSSVLPDQFEGQPTGFLIFYGESALPPTPTPTPTQTFTPRPRRTATGTPVVELTPTPVEPTPTPVPPTRLQIEFQAMGGLDAWGIPVSRPVRDPRNRNLISVRLEHGVFRYDSNCRCTAPVPLGAVFKAMLTGVDLPADLEPQAPDNPFFRQYDVSTETGPYRPWALPNTDLSYAFLPSLQEPVSTAIAPAQRPLFAPTSTPVGAEATATALRALTPSATPVTPTPASVQRSVSAAPAVPPPPPPAPTVGSAPPAPAGGSAPITRAPETIILAENEAGRETTRMSVETGDDGRARWAQVQYARTRQTQAYQLGPVLMVNKVWVAKSIDLARAIYGEQI